MTALTTAAGRTSRPGTTAIGRVVVLLAWPTLVATAVALSPWTQRHWALDLTVHMRAHLMVGAALLVPLLWWCGRQYLAVLCILAAIIHAWVVQPWALIATRSADAAIGSVPAPAVVRVVFWNVYMGNDDARPLLRLIDQHNTDVVVLLEFNAALRSALGPLRESHPHYRELSGVGDAFGVAIYSRIAGSITRGRLRHSIPDLTLRTTPASGPACQITGVHLYPPVGNALWRGRDAQLSDLAHQLAADTHLPRIVGGDFNITPWADAYRRFLRIAGLTDTRAGFGFQATWPRRLGPFGIPIDQVAVDRAVQVLERRVVFPSPESDHAAVLLTVALPPPTDATAPGSPAAGASP